MDIGVPKEIKEMEFRVSLTPNNVMDLVEHGHRVFVQKSAGQGAGFGDAAYEAAGAILLDTLEETYEAAEMVVKVKEPLPRDHPLFRLGLKSILSWDPRYEVVGEAGTATEALKLVSKLAPDFMIVDISLPDRNGIELTREALKVYPGCKILIVSMHTKIYYVTEALRNGALGYLVKESTSEILLKGLETISRGKHFLDPSLPREITENFMGTVSGVPKMIDMAYKRLTKREQEVMRLVSEGLTAKEISEKLFISKKTVDHHRANIMKKLGIHRTVELIRYAARIGLLDLDIDL